MENTWNIQAIHAPSLDWETGHSFLIPNKSFQDSIAFAHLWIAQMP